MRLDFVQKVSIVVVVLMVSVLGSAIALTYELAVENRHNLSRDRIK